MGRVKFCKCYSAELGCKLLPPTTSQPILLWSDPWHWWGIFFRLSVDQMFEPQGLELKCFSGRILRHWSNKCFRTWIDGRFDSEIWHFCNMTVLVKTWNTFWNSSGRVKRSVARIVIGMDIMSVTPTFGLFPVYFLLEMGIFSHC